MTQLRPLLSHGLRAPFLRWRLSLLLLVLFGVPYLLVMVGVPLLLGMLPAYVYGDSFFDLASDSNPILLQHMMWLLGHPEFWFVVLAVPLLTLCAWGEAIWYQQGRLRTGWRHVWCVFIVQMVILGFDLMLTGLFSLFNQDADISLPVWAATLFITLRLAPSLVSPDASIWPRWRESWRSTAGQNAVLIGSAVAVVAFYYLLWVPMSLLAERAKIFIVSMDFDLPLAARVFLHESLVPLVDLLLMHYFLLVTFALVEQVAAQSSDRAT